jgi:DNA sulfur modification protein DndD
MRIQDITLTNFRLYRGVNKISFQQDEEGKNIYLISGENGFGKTTFLHSLLWCLYGRLMSEIDDTARKEINNCGGYNSFLVSNLNNNAKQYVESIGSDTISRIKKSSYAPDDEDIQSNAIYSIAITFTDISIPSIPCQTITIIRSYDFIKQSEAIDVLIDNQKNELAQSIGNDVFINDFILNKDIARFFFFDSERIVALAETNTVEDRRRLASAYNEVLGVKKYEDLKHNLEALRLKFRKRTSDVESRNKLNALLDKNEKLQNELQLVNDTIAAHESELEALRQRDKEFQEKLLREGQGMTMDEYERQKAVLDKTREKDAAIREQLRDFIEYAPFAMTGDLLKRTIAEITKDYNAAKAAQNIANQNNLLQAIYDQLIGKLVPLAGAQGTKMQAAVRDVLESFREEDQDYEPLLSVNRDEFNESQSVYANLTTTYRVEFEHLADDYKKNKQVMSRVQQKLSSMQANESDEIIKQIRAQKSEIEKTIKKLDEEIRALFVKHGTILQELNMCKKHISEMSKKVSLDDSDVKKDALADELIESLDTFLRNLKEEKKVSLERRLKGVMNKLMHKEDFIGNVSVDVQEEGLDIILYTPDGKVIRKESLSKGEQQLYATSLLKALVEESGIEFPVFIDSPLQKFDKSHSSKIITEFYPSISKQVVLFPLLHKELTEDELEIMKPLVKSAYLIKNEVDHSYFKQVPVDKLMND